MSLWFFEANPSRVLAPTPRDAQINLPQDVSEALARQWGDLPKHVLESIAIEGYRAGALTEYQVGQMLGIDDRFEISGFLGRAGVFGEYDERELDEQLELASKAADRHSREMSRP